MVTSDFTKHYNQTHRGIATLVSILAVGAIGVAIVIPTLLLGVGTSKTGFAYEQGNQAKAFANACAEEALQQIRESTAYTGSDNLSFGQGTCAYMVTSQGGENRTITASGEVGTIVRKVEVVIGAIQPVIQVTYWLEVE